LTDYSFPPNRFKFRFAWIELEAEGKIAVVGSLLISATIFVLYYLMH